MTHLAMLRDFSFALRHQIPDNTQGTICSVYYQCQGYVQGKYFKYYLSGLKYIKVIEKN